MSNNYFKVISGSRNHGMFFFDDRNYDSTFDAWCLANTVASSVVNGYIVLYEWAPHDGPWNRGGVVYYGSIPALRHRYADAKDALDKQRSTKGTALFDPELYARADAELRACSELLAEANALRSAALRRVAA